MAEDVLTSYLAALTAQTRMERRAIRAGFKAQNEELYGWGELVSDLWHHRLTRRLATQRYPGPTLDLSEDTTSGLVPPQQ